MAAPTRCTSARTTPTWPRWRRRQIAYGLYVVIGVTLIALASYNISVAGEEGFESKSLVGVHAHSGRGPSPLRALANTRAPPEPDRAPSKYTRRGVVLLVNTQGEGWFSL